MIYLVALFYSNNLLTSDTTRKHFYDHEMKVIGRFNQYPEHYQSVASVTQFKEILCNIVDYQIFA